MHSLFTNVFFKKEKEFDDCINITFWIVLITKNILKWLFAFLVVEINKTLLIVILFLPPLLKIIIVGLRSLLNFKNKFRRFSFIIFMLVEIIFECLFELPAHFFFPRNIIYYHTIYFKIYDKASYRNIECLSEIIEGFIINLYIVNLFMNSTTGLSLIALFLIIFCPICVIYFALAMGYFFFFDPPTKEDTINKDFYGLTISSTKTIPYEVKSQTARKISSEDVSKTIIENDTKTKNLDGANYNLVNSIRK